jgi:hypothetical protein
MIALYITLAVIGVLVFLWFFAICPANGRKAAAFDGKFIAHRGLHGGDIKENTREAFEKPLNTATESSLIFSFQATV